MMMLLETQSKLKLKAERLLASQTSGYSLKFHSQVSLMNPLKIPISTKHAFSNNSKPRAHFTNFRSTNCHCQTAGSYSFRVTTR